MKTEQIILDLDFLSNIFSISGNQVILEWKKKLDEINLAFFDPLLKESLNVKANE